MGRQTRIADAILRPLAAIASLLTVFAVVQAAETRERLFKSGAEVIASTPQAFAAAIKEEMTILGKVIKDAGIRDE